mgnify:CR=1 FL=1
MASVSSWKLWKHASSTYDRNKMLVQQAIESDGQGYDLVIFCHQGSKLLKPPELTKSAAQLEKDSSHILCRMINKWLDE